MTSQDPSGPAAQADAAAAPARVEARACLNCGTPLPAPSARFCPECGQDTRERAPSIREFARQFAGQYVAADGKLWRTLGLLLARPGSLTQAYLAGRRRCYVMPLRLYLTVSLLVLLGMSVLINARVADLRPPDIDLAESHFLFIGADPLRVGVDGGRFYCTWVPKAVCRRLEERLMSDPSAMMQRSLAAFERTVGRLGAAMAVLMPMFALLLRLAFARSRWRYAEHLVFALHVHCFWLLAVGVAATGVPGLKHAAGLAVPVYGALAAWRVYGGPWWALALRLVAVTVAYAALLLYVLAAVYVWELMQ